MEEGEPGRITKFSETDRHLQMPGSRLGAIGAAESIPPGEAEAKVAVRFAGDDRMMDPVHVRGDEQGPQPAIDAEREADVAVVEDGCRIEDDFEEEDCQRRRPEEQDRSHFDTDGEDDLQRVKAVGGAGIQIEIAMMHAMQPPQKWKKVEEEMLEVDDQIEGQYGEDDRQP